VTGFDADVLIVGGGPAGLAAAIHAVQAGLSVVVCEPRTSPVDKACGEGIMPGGLAVLDRLGVRPAGVPFRGIAYIRGRRRAEALFRSGPGLGVRRTELHRALSEVVKSLGVEVLDRRVTSVSQDDSSVTAAGLRARWLIGADGLHSVLRRELGVTARAGSPRRFGVRQHFGTPAWSEFVEVWWSDFGEAYVTPVAPDLVGVAILSDRKPELAWFPELRERLGEGGPPRGAGPLRQLVSRRVAGRALLIGDAAGYEDALTGEGISLAVKQAGAAIEAIRAGDPGGYERSWRRITREYRMLTRGLVVTTRPGFARRAIVPLAGALSPVFSGVVNILAR
jgi:flavin-dependent dehydrogenase